MGGQRTSSPAKTSTPLQRQQPVGPAQPAQPAQPGFQGGTYGQPVGPAQPANPGPPNLGGGGVPAGPAIGASGTPPPDTGGSSGSNFRLPVDNQGSPAAPDYTGYLNSLGPNFGSFTPADMQSAQQSGQNAMNVANNPVKALNLSTPTQQGNFQPNYGAPNRTTK